MFRSMALVCCAAMLPANCSQVAGQTVKPIVPRSNSVKIDVGRMNVLATPEGQAKLVQPDATTNVGLATTQTYADAFERMSRELADMLAKKKVLLVWAFAESETMADDREEVLTRIDRMYQQLGLTEPGKAYTLATAVVSYGNETTNHTPQPLYKPAEIEKAIEAVASDPSGKEMQCDAVLFALETFAELAKEEDRQLALVLVTDQSGDPTTNVTKLEPAIAAAKAARCRIYVLGREAVFGSRHARLRWVDEFRQTHWLPIDRGPETAAVEVLQINGLHRRWDALPSGVGPYEQSRMARETGGVFFLLPSPEVDLVGRRADLVYEFGAMRPYVPDLSSRVDYLADRDKSPFRAAVAEVIHVLDPYEGPYGDPTSAARSKVEVRVDHFPIDPAAFAKEAQTNMQKALGLINYLKMAQKDLEAVAPLKSRETSPRWRANYDLLYAQVIAYQARLHEYGWYLSEFINTPKKITNKFGPARPTNGWDVGTVQRLLKPDATKPTRDKADELFRWIIKDYPETPWAARAQEELHRGYGIELQEDFEDPRSRGVRAPYF